MLNSINVSEFNSCLQFQNCELKKKKKKKKQRAREKEEKKRKEEEEEDESGQGRKRAWECNKIQFFAIAFLLQSQL